MMMLVTAMVGTIPIRAAAAEAEAAEEARRRYSNHPKSSSIGPPTTRRRRSDVSTDGRSVPGGLPRRCRNTPGVDICSTWLSILRQQRPIPLSPTRSKLRERLRIWPTDGSPTGIGPTCSSTLVSLPVRGMAVAVAAEAEAVAVVVVEAAVVVVVVGRW